MIANYHHRLLRSSRADPSFQPLRMPKTWLLRTVQVVTVEQASEAEAMTHTTVWQMTKRLLIATRIVQSRTGQRLQPRGSFRRLLSTDWTLPGRTRDFMKAEFQCASLCAVSRTILQMRNERRSLCRLRKICSYLPVKPVLTVMATQTRCTRAVEKPHCTGQWDRKSRQSCRSVRRHLT